MMMCLVVSLQFATVYINGHMIHYLSQVRCGVHHRYAEFVDRVFRVCIVFSGALGKSHSY